MLHKELTLELDIEDVLAVGIAHVCCCEFMWAVHALGGYSMQPLLSVIGINLTVRLEQMCPSNLLTGDADCVCQWIEVGLGSILKALDMTDTEDIVDAADKTDTVDVAHMADVVDLVDMAERWTWQTWQSGGLGGDIGCDGP